MSYRYGTPYGEPGTPGIPSSTPQTMGDVESLTDRVRTLMARRDLDAGTRTRLDAALGRLRQAAEEISDLWGAAEWLSDDRGDPRPCRYWFEHAQRYCGRPSNDLPSHGESFAAHPYAPERRAPRPTGQKDA